MFMNADASGAALALREVRNDERKMARLGDHRVVLVARALGVVPGMDVNIGNDSHVEAPTLVPNGAEPRAVEFDDAAREAGGVDVVVEEKLPNRARASLDRAEEEGAALAAAAGAARELIDTGIPDARRANELRRPPQRCTQQR